MNAIWENLDLENMNDEIWKDIPGYEGLYQASNLGRIKSISREVTLFHGGAFFTKERILSQRLSGKRPLNMYLFVALFKDGARMDIQVHIIIGRLFVPNPFGYKILNHLKGIKTDNRAAELEWTTYSGNAIHAYKTGLHKGAARGKFGLKHPGARKVQCLLTGRIVCLKEAAIWLQIPNTTLFGMLKGRSNNWTNFIYY